MGKKGKCFAQSVPRLNQNKLQKISIRELQGNERYIPVTKDTIHRLSFVMASGSNAGRSSVLRVSRIGLLRNDRGRVLERRNDVGDVGDLSLCCLSASSGEEGEDREEDNRRVRKFNDGGR